MKLIHIILASLMGLTVCSFGQNLFDWDTSAETGIDKMTLGRYSSGIIPCFSDAITAFDGKRCIRVDWDKTRRRVANNSRGEDYLVSTASSRDLQEGETYTFSFYAKASADQYPLRLEMFPGAGYEYSVPEGNFSKDLVLGTEWKRYSFSFIPKMQAAAPIKGYLAVFNFKESPAGSVWYDAIQLEKGGTATPYKNSSRMNVGVSLNSPHWSNLYSPEEPIMATVHIDNPSKKAELQCRVVDYQGKEIKNFKQRVNGLNEIKIPVKNSLLGWFKVTVELSVGGKIASSSSANYIRIAKPVDVAPGLQPYSGLINAQGYDYNEISKKLGSKRAEIFSDWKEVETSPGKFDWSVVEWRLKRSKEFGMLNKVLVNPFEVPSWYFDKEELVNAKKMNSLLVLGHDQMEHWCEFIGELTRRYGDLIDELELGAEDNGRLGKSKYYMRLYPQEVRKNSAGSPFIVGGKPFDDLCEMVKVGAEEIRKTHPNMKIGAIRPSRSSNVDDLLFTREMFKKIGKEFNILPADFYFYPFDFGPFMKDRRDKSDGLIEIYNAAKKITQEEGCNQPIYMSEFGWFPDKLFPDESIYRQEQAETMPKDFIVARIAGYYAFDWFMGFDGVTGSKYSPSMHQSQKIQSVAASYSAVARVVENVTESQWLTPDSVSRIAIMRKNDGQGVAAVWAAKGYGLSLPQGTDVAVTDVMGNPIQLSKGHLPLSQAPIYIWHKDFQELSQILARAEVEASEFCDIRFRMVSEAIGRLQFTNFSSNSDLEINADITVNGEVISKVIDVPKGSNNSCDIPLSGKTILVKASKNQGTSVMKKSFDLDALTPIAQGGQADSLIGIANSRGDMMPPDPWVPWSGPDDLSVRITSSWDKTSLHLKVKVKDVFFPNRFPEAPCHGDAVQIAIDPKNKGSFYIPTQNSEKLGPDVFEFALALNDDGKSRCVSSHGKNLCVSNNYTITRDEEEKTTNYELHLAWADLGVDPYEGMVLGVSFVVSDGDTGSGATYYAPIGGGVAGQKNPALYKKLILK